MLYDLNIAWTPSTTPSELTQTLRFSAQLGYNVVALNHTLSPPIAANITNPLPRPGAPGAANRKSAAQDASSSSSPPLPTVLHRATVTIADPSVNHRLPAIAAAYDVVAVRPTTEKAFQAACVSISEASLISLDLATHFPFHFRPKPVMAAVARGLRLELCYAPALTTTADNNGGGGRARALALANVASLVRATRGRGLVLSSGAARALQLRGPADVVNLFAVWGLGPERGAEALAANPRAVVVNEGLRRTGYRGVVDVVCAAEAPPPAAAATAVGDDDDDDDDEQQAGRAGKRGGAGETGTGLGGGKKRKNGPGHGDVGNPGEAGLSKRQRKKMKAAEREAAVKNKAS